MSKFQNLKAKLFKDGKPTKSFWVCLSNILVWSLIGTFLLIGGLRFADKKSGYKVLNNHVAVVVSDSMSKIHPDNTSYMPKDAEQIEKGDIIKAKEYKDYESVELYDVVIYTATDGNLIVHRVIDKYENKDGKWIVTKGDANSAIDTPVSFDIVRGKVIKKMAGAGKVVMFMQSPYFLIALFGSGFSILAGFLLVEIFGKKKKDDEDENSPKNPGIPEKNAENPVKKDSKGRFVSTKIIVPFIGSILVVGSLGIASALIVKTPNEIGFGIGSTNRGFYVNVYDGTTLVTSQVLDVNPDNDKELCIQNLTLEKGYKVKCYNAATSTYFGGNYSHNISVGATVASGLVSSDDDYIAVQTGTYDFYFKFTSNDYSSYDGTYINVDNVKTFYLQDTLNKGFSPAVHYWGDDVIVSNADNYWGGDYVGSEGGHGMYEVHVPGKATQFNFSHDYKYSQNFTISSLGTSNAFWLDSSGNSGSYTWNP